MRRRNGSHDYIHLPTKRNRIWFCPPIPIEQLAKTRIAYNGCGFTNLRGGHRRLRLCFFATAVTDERVADRLSDDQREERSVKPLLCAVAISVQPPALPRTAGPKQGGLSLSSICRSNENNVTTFQVWVTDAIDNSLREFIYCWQFPCLMSPHCKYTPLCPLK